MRLSSFFFCVCLLRPVSDAAGCVVRRTYDEYSSELTSGHLSWTPVHESDAFWRENAMKLNDRDYEQLKYVFLTLLVFPLRRTYLFYFYSNAKDIDQAAERD